MRYTPSSPKERQQMLEYLGVEDVNGLFSDIPDKIRLSEGLKLGEGLCEQEILDHMREISAKNRVSKTFLGAGCYRHYVPAAVEHLLSRSEFYTSYTPYQAEASQGVLQALFEYQSLMCELTGQQVCNATVYDGSTALAEACVMAHRITGRGDIVVSDTLHPHYLGVLRTYCEAGDLNLLVVKSKDGSSANLQASDETAAVVVQTPNYYGIIEDTGSLYEGCSENGALLVACVLEATSLGLLNPPQADITCGDGHCFGNRIQFGGPSYGILATKMKYVRQLPGRLVGETLDKDGERGFVLTLQAREQHIRREKATSNICTSQSLCAIAAAAHLALIGPDGLRQTALNSHLNACYLAGKIGQIDGCELVYDRPFYNEFLMKCPIDAYEKILGAGFTPGHPLGDGMLFCTTELHTRSDLDEVVEVLK